MTDTSIRKVDDPDRTAPARRSRVAGLGNMPTTSMRWLIALSMRSRGLVDQVFFECATGKSANAETSASRSAHIRDSSDLEIPVSAPRALIETHDEKQVSQRRYLPEGSMAQTNAQTTEHGKDVDVPKLIAS